MRYLVLLLLLFCIEGKAQSYTFTLNECRVEATTGELRESFLVDRIRYFDRGDQTFIFDHESVLSVFDANITNYGRDSLKALIDIWIDSCNVVPIPTPPGPSALFANTTSFDANGIDEYVTVADADNLSFTDGAGTDEAFSISSWIYVETDQQGVVVAKDSTALQEYRLAYSTSANYDIYFLLYKSDGTAYIGREDDSGLALNQWNHITVTYSAATETSADIKIYRNGIRVDDANLTLGSYTGMTNTITPLTIGDKLVSLPLDGKIDQPTVFNKELSIEEVKELMALRDYSYFSDTASIVSSWYMDSPDDLGVAGGVTDRFGSNEGTGVNTTTADNLVECIEYPYDYQLDTSALYTNLTPMQNDSADAEMGFAWDLNGTNSYIDFGDSDDFSFTDGAGNDEPFSISIWANTSDLLVGNDGYISKTQASYEWALYKLTNKLYFRLWSSNNNAIYLQVTENAIWQNLPSNRKINIIATYDGSETHTGLKMYINTDDISLTSVAGAYVGMSNTTQPLWVGRYSAGAYHEGTLDEAIIFNKELSQAEVTTLYNSHGLIDARDTDLSANIVGYWNGYNSTNTAGGVLDLSGNGNNGTPTNMDLADFQYDSPRSIFEADSAASFSFDGSTEYLTVTNPADSSLSFGNGTTDEPFSISGWIKTPDGTGTDRYLVGKGTAGKYEYTVKLQHAGDAITLRLFSNGTTTDLERESVLSSMVPYYDQWIFWTVTYNGNASAYTDIKIYHNGIDVSGNDKSTGSYVSMNTYTDALNIGRAEFVPTLLFNGEMAHTTFYDVELTQCEIQEIFNDGSPVDPRLTTVSANVISHWRLNSGDDVNGTVLDIVGSNNGTSVNAPTLDETSYPTN